MHSESGGDADAVFPPENKGTGILWNTEQTFINKSGKGHVFHAILNTKPVCALLELYEKNSWRISFEKGGENAGT